MKLTQDCMLPLHSLGVLLILYGTYVSCQNQPKSPCERGTCITATGNLLIGREKKLSASSTCGLTGQERYCIVSFLEDKKNKCFLCDSTPRYDKDPAWSHKIHNVVGPTIGKLRPWWQSENGVENVTIQLDMEAEFHFTHLIMTFKTFRPAAMFIERSRDFGKTWHVYRYFAADCAKSFPGISREPPKNLTHVVCESRYSPNYPSSGGEVILKVLPSNLQHLSIDPYSPDVQNLIKMTNLRINFTKLHTLGDNLLDTRQSIKNKYYYAVNQIIVRGSCSCYGHASRCIPIPGAEDKPDMVHGMCECTHNTQGLNCEKCIDFYNDLPWKPAFGSKTNACKQCNCNNHSTKCHFDEAVFETTGRVSGGVCDGCEHNTEGRNCERCKQFFYRDPNRDFSDPEVCLRCDCDPGGSLDEGICDPYSDEAGGLVSGNCHCKPNVGGRRCDQCKDGFHNFNESSPLGCEACTCNVQGTIDAQGCNKETGDCTCKRNVEGRDCNQCLPHFWGLSEAEEDGCKACECDLGGSYDNNCDVISGQCKCKPHTSGRTCSVTQQGHFSSNLDNLVYEAENSNCKTDDCIVEIRQPSGRENSWTGTGFMKSFEQTALEFDVDNIKTPMEYDIVIRYEPQSNQDWENVEVRVDRESEVDRNGPCANAVPQDDLKVVRLPAGSRAVKVSPSTCLEPGKKYKIHLVFHQDNNNTTGPSASILIDSIALLPNIQSIPFYQGSPENLERAREFDHYRCGESYISVYRGSPIPEVCKKHQYSIGIYVHGGANECACDLTGSISGLCDQQGGNCLCKPNVVGRRCDRCAPGTFGFGPEGCKACDCNQVGALDNICDAISGQCKCRAQTYGRECDQCSPGYWNYPTCQRCICNGHADVCDSKTGTCIGCRNNTGGNNCDYCVSGYYGDPRLGIDIPCRQCPCPGTVDSGISYADRCQLDLRTQDVICECKEGYGGTRCDRCLDNYYGNPQELGGSCNLCNCSNNIDLISQGNCDTTTGKCQRCLYQTEGDHCEVCKFGFFGDALAQNCTECVCDFRGTDHSKGSCDKTTGQCPCLPNVVGFSCDACLKNHWKIASGTGCEPCDCDPVGSYSEECNEFDGQCQCKQGFGGSKCDQCQNNYWGNPNVECFPCDCDLRGSATLQCRQNNGTCVCNPGIGGTRCDTCARGYIGTAPECSPCGECFDNWDIILRDLQEQTAKVISDASNIKQTGASGAYTKEFELLEKRIEDVKALVENTTRSSHDLTTMLATIDEMKRHINGNDDPSSVGKTLANTTQRITLTTLDLNNLKERAKTLKKTGEDLKENATRLQENNVEGALALTREAQQFSLKIKMESAETEEQIVVAERQCKRTESLVTKNFPQFTQGQEENEKTLQKLNEKITGLEKNLPDLNELVCDKRGNPCDNQCGGAGCGKCGGISCDAGALSISNAAKEFAESSKKSINEKESKAEEVFRGITTARQESNAANVLAKDAYDEAARVRNKTAAYVNSTANITKKLDKFLTAPGATLGDIRTVSTQAVNKNIESKPEQILDRANEINNVIKSLTDIDTILTETADDLAKANELKAKAEETKSEAEGIRDTAQKIVEALNEAQTAQDKAESAIQTAKDDISAARQDLSQITYETNEAQQKANDAATKVKQLQDRLKSIQAGFLQNERSATDVEIEEKSLEKEVKRAQEQAANLRVRYQDTDNQLISKAESSGLKRDRGKMLLEKASQLSVNTTAKLKQLNDTETMFNSQESVLIELSTNIAELEKNIQECIKIIVDKSNYYKYCS